jgi:hypothetical protein
MNPQGHPIDTPDGTDHPHDQNAGRASLPPQTAAPITDLPLDGSVEQIDAKPQAHLLEEAWFGAEYKKQLSKPQLKALKALKALKRTGPGFGTAAFSVQGPDHASIQEPKLQEKVPATLPYETDSSSLDALLAQEHNDTAAFKAEQRLIRNGLATTNAYGVLLPLLALSGTLTSKEVKKRHTMATRLVENYVYPPGDEVKNQGKDRQPSAKVKLANLKDALRRLERPLAMPKTAKPATQGSRKSLERKAQETTSTSDEEEQQPSKRSKVNDDDLRPTLGFLKSMRDPGHPDFGFSFLAALELAMAKEMKARTLESTCEHWIEDDDDAEAAVEVAAAGTALENAPVPAGEAAAETAAGTTTRRSDHQAAKKSGLPGPSSDQKSDTPSEQAPKLKLKLTKKSTSSASPLPTPSKPSTAPLPPVTAPQPFRITGIVVKPKYDLTSFETAGVMRELGLDFGDLRMMEYFNRQLQTEDPSRPSRSQKSLLEVSQMSKDEYYGANVPLTLGWFLIRSKAFCL